MGNMLEINGWDLDDEISDLFPNSTELSVLDNGSLDTSSTQINYLDVDGPGVEEFIKNGKMNEVIDFCTKLIELSPDNPLAWLNKGNCLLKIGKYDDAIKFIDIALHKKELFIEAYYSKVKCLCLLKKQSQAIEVFDELTTKVPDNDTIHLKKGMLMTELGNKKAALDEFNKALEINPTFSMAFYFKGNTLAQMQQNNEALEAYNKAIEIDKTNLNFLLGKAVLLQTMEEVEKAQEITMKMTSIINSPTFEVKNYNMNKIQESMQMINIMTQFLNSHKTNVLELKIKIYHGEVSSFYEGIYEEKKVGVKIFPSKPKLFAMVQKHCDLLKLSDPNNVNIIRVHYCEEVPGMNSNENVIRVVIDYCAEGNLMKYLMKKRNLPLSRRYEIIRQITAGLQCLLQKKVKIIHINTRKILLDKSKTARVADNGLKGLFIENNRETIDTVKDLMIVLIEILKKPGTSYDLSNVNFLENGMFDGLSQTMKNMIYTMYNEKTEKNGINYYLEHLLDKETYIN